MRRDGYVRPTEEDSNLSSTPSASSSNSVNSDNAESTRSSRYASSRKFVTSVEELMSAEPRLRNTVIFLKILRVVAPSQSDAGMYTLKNFKKKNYGESRCAYTRLFLCLDLNSDGQTVYIGEGRGIGVNLWSNVVNVRDNGSIGIGSTIVLYSPKPISKLLGNEIPIIETNSSCRVKRRHPMDNIPIERNLEGNLTKGFVLNNCKIEIVCAEVIATNCSGYFCDRQRSSELMRSGKKCGCYQMRGIGSNLSIVHSVNFQDPLDNVIYNVEEFSSMKFSLLYLSEYFPKSTQRLSYDPSIPNHENLCLCMDDVVNFYNRNGGFTIVGWYKRGEINDVIHEEGKVVKSDRITASSINYHISSMYPTRYTTESDEARPLKFDVINID